MPVALTANDIAGLYLQVGGIPPHLAHFFSKKYRMPFIDPFWLHDCIEFVRETYQPGRVSDSHIRKAVERQLLLSDLAESALHGTGLPAHACLPNFCGYLGGHPILVEVVAIMEIGVEPSKIEQIWIKRARQAVIEDHLAVPPSQSYLKLEAYQYPHNTLMLTLSDGVGTLEAIEQSHIPQISLGNTPLGAKVGLIFIKLDRLC
ncbi:hypothetical protein BKA70DRAFT_1133875 [Coprinopsis sp. MPI-PUGE-AT-0042]|nr:hypothetical protein BKA70DRAFT_1133875 [Coprinopsis sp. MPI-PUGE-AT-0042]